MSTSSTGLPPTDQVEVTRSAWLALAITTLVFFLVVIDISAVNVAFPSIAEGLDATRTELSWILSAYNIVVATLLLPAGRLADSVGRKKVFLPGVAVFMLGSLACGVAVSVETLIAARVLQAIGGSIIMASAIPVVLPGFPFQRRGLVIGIAGAIASLGGVAGPAIGSILLNLFDWRSIFLLNVPICLVILFLGPRLLQESSDPNATGKIDLLGVPIGTTAIAFIMFGVVQSETWGLADSRVIAFLVIGLALVPMLIWRSASHPEPVLDLDLFKVRSFASSAAGLAIYSLGFTSGFLANSLLLQDLWQQSITTTGLALMPAPICAFFASPLAGFLADRFGHRWIIGFGSVLCGIGFASYVFVLGDEPAVFNRFVPLSLLVGLGVGLTVASWASAGLSDIDQAKFGVANATVRTVQQGFFALGVSVVVALLGASQAELDLAGFKRAWIFVAVCYIASAALFMLTFPAGSSEDRADTASAT